MLGEFGRSMTVIETLGCSWIVYVQKISATMLSIITLYAFEYLGRNNADFYILIKTTRDVAMAGIDGQSRTRRGVWASLTSSA